MSPEKSNNNITDNNCSSNKSMQLLLRHSQLLLQQISAEAATTTMTRIWKSKCITTRKVLRSRRSSFPLLLLVFALLSAFVPDCNGEIDKSDTDIDILISNIPELRQSGGGSGNNAQRQCNTNLLILADSDDNGWLDQYEYQFLLMELADPYSDFLGTSELIDNTTAQEQMEVVEIEIRESPKCDILTAYYYGALLQNIWEVLSCLCQQFTTGDKNVDNDDPEAAAFDANCCNMTHPQVAVPGTTSRYPEPLYSTKLCQVLDRAVSAECNRLESTNNEYYNTAAEETTPTSGTIEQQQESEQQQENEQQQQQQENGQHEQENGQEQPQTEETEPETVAEPETVSESESEAEMVADEETATETVTEDTSQTNGDPVEETISEAETDRGSGSGAAQDTEAETGESDTGTAVETETDSETGTGTATETGAETGSATGAETDAAALDINDAAPESNSFETTPNTGNVPQVATINTNEDSMEQYHQSQAEAWGDPRTIGAIIAFFVFIFCICCCCIYENKRKAATQGQTDVRSSSSRDSPRQFLNDEEQQGHSGANSKDHNSTSKNQGGGSQNLGPAAEFAASQESGSGSDRGTNNYSTNIGAPHNSYDYRSNHKIGSKSSYRKSNGSQKSSRFFLSKIFSSMDCTNTFHNIHQEQTKEQEVQQGEIPQVEDDNKRFRISNILNSMDLQLHTITSTINNNFSFDKKEEYEQQDDEEYQFQQRQQQQHGEQEHQQVQSDDGQRYSTDGASNNVNSTMESYNSDSSYNPNGVLNSTVDTSGATLQIFINDDETSSIEELLHQRHNTRMKRRKSKRKHKHGCRRSNNITNDNNHNLCSEQAIQSNNAFSTTADVPNSLLLNNSEDEETVWEMLRRSSSSRSRKMQEEDLQQTQEPLVEIPLEDDGEALNKQAVDAHSAVEPNIIEFRKKEQRPSQVPKVDDVESDPESIGFDDYDDYDAFDEKDDSDSVDEYNKHKHKYNQHLGASLAKATATEANPIQQATAALLHDDDRNSEKENENAAGKYDVNDEDDKQHSGRQALQQKHQHEHQHGSERKNKTTAATANTSRMGSMKDNTDIALLQQPKQLEMRKKSTEIENSGTENCMAPKLTLLDPIHQGENLQMRQPIRDLTNLMATSGNQSVDDGNRISGAINSQDSTRLRITTRDTEQQQNSSGKERRRPTTPVTSPESSTTFSSSDKLSTSLSSSSSHSSTSCDNNNENNENENPQHYQREQQPEKHRQQHKQGKQQQFFFPMTVIDIPTATTTSLEQIVEETTPATDCSDVMDTSLQCDDRSESSFYMI